MVHIVGQIEFDCDIEALSEEIEKAGYVKVVRCKDCKYCFVDGDDDWRYNVCYFSCNKAQGDDWFCADGERREADETDRC